MGGELRTGDPRALPEAAGMGPGVRGGGDSLVSGDVPMAEGGDRAAVAGGMVGHDGAGGDVTRPARSVQFTVPGAPVGKGRPIAGKSFGGHTTLRTPAKTVSYENLVGWTAAQAMRGRALMEGPLKCSLHLEVAIPASWSMKRQGMALRGEIRPTTKPDLDNVAKALLDAMNGVVFKDDVQVVLLTAAKVYGASPCAQVFISELETN